MRNFVLLLGFVITLLSGCASSPDRPLTTADKVRLTRFGSEAATVAGLQFGIRDEADRVTVAVEVRDAAESALNVASSPDLTASVAQELVLRVTDDPSLPIALVLNGAIEILNVYYAPPTNPESLIGPDNLAILQAFLTGVKNGARIVAASAR